MQYDEFYVSFLILILLKNVRALKYVYVDQNPIKRYKKKNIT